MEEKTDNKNRNIIIVAVVVVVLVCCCLIAGIVGFYSFTTITSTTSSPPQSSITETTEEALPTYIGIDDPPSGGLGNDILRQDTWQVMAPAAVGLGCDQPVGADSTIEVLQQPDTSGVWVEKWTVMCNSGDTYAFEVEFVLDASGATFNIKSLP